MKLYRYEFDRDANYERLVVFVVAHNEQVARQMAFDLAARNGIATEIVGMQMISDKVAVEKETNGN